jgi:hypothetical protein
MKTARLLVLFSVSATLLSLFSCAHVDSSPSTSDLLVIVYRADTHEPISDVFATVISDSGQVIDVGKTDYYGHVYVSKKLIEDAVAILFCRERFFCGAFSMDRTNLMDYEEVIIHIAPFYL